MYQISSSDVRANKTHICNTCHSTILKGVIYNRSVNKFDGEIYTWKQCKLCDPIVTRMFKEGYYPDGISDSDFYDFINDNNIKFIRRE